MGARPFARVGWREAAVSLIVLLGAALVALLGPPGGLAGGSVDPADLTLTKSDSPDPVARGGTLVYAIQVRNLGPDPAMDSVVTDKLPGGVDFISASTTRGSCQRQGGRVRCSLGNLGNGETATITVQVQAQRRGSINNTASISSDVVDPVAANNSATESTRVTEPGGGGRPAGPACRRRTATLVGTAGNDRGPRALVGTGGRDVIVAFGGDDEIFSGGGRDLICAGAGDDLVVSGTRPDVVWAGTGHDRVLGRGGDDVLRGNRGRDRLLGNRGADLLIGGRGFDRCFGGPGRDQLRSCP
jgi:uncharacterized repeat protein (TIGR01451 family)